MLINQIAFNYFLRNMSLVVAVSKMKKKNDMNKGIRENKCFLIAQLQNDLEAMRIY